MRMRCSLLPALAGSLLLTGCALSPTATPTAQTGMAIEGSVYGGQQPINLAHIYLMQANTTGYGAASISLLDPTLTGNSDAVGGYVTTNARGGFHITGDYTCTPGTQVYLLVLQGDAGGGNNIAVGEMGVIGQCPAVGNFLAAVPFVQINEVTTVATAYALAGFATDALHVSSSGTALAQVGIANAFANANNIANVQTAPNTGALGTTPAGNGVVPAALVNTMAGIIAACVNSTGPSGPACSSLLATALSNGTTGTAPTETATALINIAHNPTANVAALYSILPAVPPFQPVLNKQPADFTLALTFTASRYVGGFASTAIDGAGAFWGVQASHNLLKLNALGVDQTTSTTYVADSSTDRIPTQIAIDTSGNAYVGNNSRQHTPSITKYSSAGALLTSGIGYPLPGNFGTSGANYLALDPQGNLWANTTSGLLEYSPSGGLISPQLGFSYGVPEASIAIDPIGYVWITSQNGLLKVNPAGVAVSGSPYQGGLQSIAQGTATPYRAPAIDAAGNIWYAVQGSSGPNVNVNASNGTALFPSGTGPASLQDPTITAIDGSGAVFIVDDVSRTVVKLVLTSANGAAAASTVATTFSSVLAGTIDAPLAIDGSGDVWVSGTDGENSTNTGTVNPRIVEYIGLAAPVVTPISVGTANGQLGTRP